ncbi:MAG: hypothetical protein ACYTXA_15195 [Nostoc sp.]
MDIRFILSDYVDRAIAQAIYDKLEDGTFAGRIPVCKGVIAFASTLRECGLLRLVATSGCSSGRSLRLIAKAWM